MKMHWILIAGLTLFTACGREIPRDIIQPDQMEKVLYDYHLAMGMTGTKYDENHQKEAFKNFVFDKHHITEAEFDSSMVWYTRHSNELAAIYDKLGKRFGKEQEQMNTLVEALKEDTRYASGDTVDIWKKKKIYWLDKNPIHNQLLVNMKPDTTFHTKDAFCWQMDYHFLSPGKAVMGLSIVYDNDSVVGKTQTITESGNHSIYLHTDSAFVIKNLNGFIQVMSDSVSRNPHLLVHGISLMRYHAQNDSLATALPSATKMDMMEEEAPE